MAAIKNAPIYSDLNLSFTPHPLTGDLVPLTNVDAIRRAIRTLFSLEAFDIPFEPKKKSGLKQMLFEPASHLTEVAIQTQLEWLFKKLEKRANLISTTVNADATGQGYQIVITYNIKSLAQTDTYSFYVERVR